jgi:hypothetical protein
MVTGGQELILGGRQDPQFGPVILAGLGGIFVEIIGEATKQVPQRFSLSILLKLPIGHESPAR